MKDLDTRLKILEETSKGFDVTIALYDNGSSIQYSTKERETVTYNYVSQIERSNIIEFIRQLENASNLVIYQCERDEDE